MTTPTAPPEITALLEPGETVVWSGQPVPYAYVVRGLPAIAYGITWSVLGAFWYHGAGGVGRYSAFEGWWRIVPLLSLPFILTGFSFFFHPLTLGGKARRTWYIVTNRRAFIAELPHRNKPLQVRFFMPADMAEAETRPRLDSLVDLLIAARARTNPHLTTRFEDAFLGLRDAPAALAALQAASRPPAAAS